MRTRTRFEKPCSATGTPSKTVRRSRSSTRAVSRMKRCANRVRQPLGPPEHTGGCTSRAAERIWPTTGSRACPNVTVVSRRSEETPAFVAGDVGAIGCVQADARLDRIRAFVRVQDGCSFSCNFCVIPLVRGRSRSRSAEAVLGEVRKRVEQGHSEVVLTGINLGCFRDRDRGYTLARLVREVGEVPGLRRLRLSSIEVNHVGDDLVRALRETPNVARHLHVPLQSGDDRVLSAMGRRYTAATYLRRVSGLTDFNLTADVIVGFPTEDDRAFERTREVVREAGITKVHVFPYSPRPGRPRRLPMPSLRRSRNTAAQPSATTRTTRASAAGEGRSVPRTRCWSTARAAATETTTHRG